MVFLRSRAGKAVPVDAATIREADIDFDHTRHVSHFATCPAAAKFRKKKNS
jgi:hypothetical protein